jgi:DNA-binding PadR family transcriptional regulator
MLTEEPMHAYRMQQLVKERRKDDVVNVSQRNSVYQTIERLVREGLVAVASTERPENRPERITYRITDAGRSTLAEWLRDMLSTPAREYPVFPAALSFLPNLAPAEAIEVLTTRVTHLQERMAALSQEITEVGRYLPRLFAIESEYQHQVVEAELAYVRGLIKDLQSEQITWPSADNTPTSQDD